jgi:glycosyltransferase involved in cell wall biosynthesis
VEAVRHGVTGFLVPPDDPAELAVALRRLLADAGLRQRLGAAGRHWVETEMNWDRAAAQFAALLAERA